MLKASERVRWNLDRIQMGYLALFFVIAAAMLWYSYRRASTPILRQQLKWVTRGTISGHRAFHPVLRDSLPAGTMPSPAMKVSVLSLGLLPLTFGYAIFRYRLMDVDLIFKRGMCTRSRQPRSLAFTSRWWLESPNWSIPRYRVQDRSA